MEKRIHCSWILLPEFTKSRCTQLAKWIQSGFKVGCFACVNAAVECVCLKHPSKTGAGCPASWNSESHKRFPRCRKKKVFMLSVLNLLPICFARKGGGIPSLSLSLPFYLAVPLPLRSLPAPSPLTLPMDRARIVLGPAAGLGALGLGQQSPISGEGGWCETREPPERPGLPSLAPHGWNRQKGTGTFCALVPVTKRSIPFIGERPRANCGAFLESSKRKRVGGGWGGRHHNGRF